MRIAILDDYQDIALSMADWSILGQGCSIDVFKRNLSVPDEAVELLRPYDVLCTMRERMAIPRSLIGQLPNLKLITITGAKHRTLDMAAATERGIIVSHTKQYEDRHWGTPELTWGLVIASVRHMTLADRRMRAGAWQTTMGVSLHGKTLGLVGLGNIGRIVAGYGHAFGMRVIAWSQNLTPEAAAAAGVTAVSKEDLFRQSDVISIHVVLSERSRGIVGAGELSLMKPTAHLVNTSRGPIVDEASLVAALKEKRIAGAALDVFAQEPLPVDHPLRGLDNTVLTPHLGYVTEDVMRGFHEDTVEAIQSFMTGQPIRVLNPQGG
jgi:phosphoglycerate dehydrogenase-like enzyme